ncbi:MAG: helix-turn-helix domain-containing protein [Eubacteriales bacterium]
MENHNSLNAKDRILEAATRLFIEKGYKETTSRMIAKEANVNLGLLPYYFEKKENIAINVYSKHMKSLNQKIDYKMFNIENSIEHFLFTYAMLQYHMNQEPGLMKLYLELIKEDIMLYSIEEYTVRSLELVEREYNLILGDNDLTMALNVIKGMERTLMLGKKEKKNELDDYAINVEIIKCGLLYLGVERGTLEKNVDSVEMKLHTAGIDFEVFKHHM